jgi:hypothetical protein
MNPLENSFKQNNHQETPLSNKKVFNLDDVPNETTTVVETNPQQSWRDTYELEQLLELGALAEDFIREYAQSLGVDSPLTKRPIDVKWGADSEEALGTYDYTTNRTGIENTYPGRNFAVLLHEGLHHVASFKNSHAGESAQEKNIEPKRRVTKTGFASYWKTEAKEKTTFTGNLKNLNEAVTEKIAQELFTKTKDSLASIYATRYRNTLNRRNTFLEKTKQHVLRESPRLSAKIHSLIIDPDQSLEEYQKEWEKEIETRYKKEQSVPFNLSYIAESQKAYLPEIGVLEAILFTLAKKRSKENTISLEDAYGIEWKDLQRAYFEGNTLFLRRIDTILGEGTLRAFDSIKRPSGKDTEKYNQFLIDMKTLEIKIQSS